jgi:LPXTG-motif cell wall-anchored protein
MRYPRRTPCAMAAIVVASAIGCATVNLSGVEATTLSITQVGDDIESLTASDSFGGAVAMSSDGTRIAIGATGNNAGYVRAYNWNGSAWAQVGADIAGAVSGDRFGESIAMSATGSRMAVGAPGDNEGYVRVYDLVGNTWTQVGNFDGTVTGEYFGGAVALSSDGSRLAIGATETGASGPARGQVRVFDWDGSAWVQAGSAISGEADNDSFGVSVALSSDGSRIAVGAGNNDGVGGVNNAAGHVRVYDLIGNTWTQIGSDIDGEAAVDQFGQSVAMSADGTRIASGAWGNDDGGTNAGHVRVYDLVGGTWTQVGADIDGEAAVDGSGERVAMSDDGTRIAISAPQNAGNGLYAGHVRIYDLVGGTWTQVGVDIDGEAAYDSLSSVAMSADGSHIAVGASSHDLDVNTQDSGHVRVFGVPVKPAAPTITALEAGDRTLTVSFTAGSDGGVAISNYKYSTDGINYVALNPAATTSPVTITGLTNQTIYSVTLKAVNAMGDSVASNSVSGTPSAPAAAPPSTTAPTEATSTSTTTPATTNTITTVKNKTTGLPEAGGQTSKSLLIAGLLVTGGLVVLGRRRMRFGER